MSIKINRVYTRSGDKGQTGLVGGERTSKASKQVQTYGDIDELNCVLGLARTSLNEATKSLDPILENLQQELFDVGAEIASPPGAIPDSMWTVEDTAVARLEKLCDELGRDLPELDSFILPGGSRVCAEIHLARAVCRRAERSLVELRDEQAALNVPVLNEAVLRYVNRLSDALFIAARWALAAEGKTAPLWQPAGKRNQS
ncbi:MAG: cob(I)yrinic acid a,c-diamide adenosyltransferase [Bdellovibrionales bacterium]|nr:cob(I)yrinic acid a,c-diamide adenosyltransferase [Bdellovibrionales bacterium]